MAIEELIPVLDLQAQGTESPIRNALLVTPVATSVQKVLIKDISTGPPVISGGFP